MSIPARLVKQLRDMSGAGMMDAKRSLVENNGDIEASLDWLRTKGLAKAAKKSGRTASEGLVGVAVSDGVGVVVEINAETDFVAKNVEFQQLVKKVTDAALGVDDIDSLRSADLGGSTVEEEVAAKIATIGENMSVRRMVRLTGDHVTSYVHNAAAGGMGKIGTIVAINGSDTDTARKIAMHVAASSPVALTEAELDPELVEREQAILSEQARQSGKPEKAVEMMVAGRWRKYCEEFTLLRQKFVMDPDQTVGAVAEKAGIEILGFARLEVGEGIERNEEDFATEVARAMGG